MAGKTRFTKFQMNEIHNRFRMGHKQAAIAREFNITQGYVSKLKAKWAADKTRFVSLGDL